MCDLDVSTFGCVDVDVVTVVSYVVDCMFGVVCGVVVVVVAMDVLSVISDVVVVVDNVVVSCVVVYVDKGGRCCYSVWC